MDARYRNWTPRRAARAGYLAGRGFAKEEILRDRIVAVHSERALLQAFTRWHVTIGNGTWPLALDPETESKLIAEANRRGISVNALLTEIVTTVLKDDLITAVIGDEETNGRGEARRID